jgi:hypothetical protein
MFELAVNEDIQKKARDSVQRVEKTRKYSELQVSE